MLKLTRLFALAAMVTMTFGPAVQAKEREVAPVKLLSAAQSAEFVDFTLYWYV